MRAPTWLKPEGQKLWKKLFPLLTPDPAHLDTFAVLCECYADYRGATDFRERKIYLDTFVRLSKEFGLTPRTSKKPKQEVEEDDLTKLLAG